MNAGRLAVAMLAVVGVVASCGGSIDLGRSGDAGAGSGSGSGSGGPTGSSDETAGSANGSAAGGSAGSSSSGLVGSGGFFQLEMRPSCGLPNIVW